MLVLLLFRLLAEVGPATIWLAGFVMAVVATFVVLIAIVVRATIRAPGADQRLVLYLILHDLLDLFQGRRRK